MINLETPLTKEKIEGLKIGDRVLLTGMIYTARDQAHKRLTELIKKGEELPFDIKNATIYYVGPAPARPGAVIGSAGPTTSYRMDAYTPLLIKAGQMAMIGKGPRNDEVIAAIKEKGAVYFAAIGGAGALISKCIMDAKEIAFPELGTESIKQLTVKDLPLIVAVDPNGNDIYRKGFQDG